MRSEVPCQEVAPTPPLAPPVERPCLAVVPSGVEAFGARLSVTSWSRVTGLSINALRRRLSLFPAEIALLLPTSAHADPDAEPGGPHSWTWELLSWEEDHWARAFVATHPEGASLEEVGSALGIVKERVRQVEEQALRKLVRRRQAEDLLKILRDLRAEQKRGCRGTRG